MSRVVKKVLSCVLVLAMMLSMVFPSVVMATEPAADGEGTVFAVNGEGTAPTVNDEGTQPTVNDEGTQPTVNDEGTQPTVNDEGTQPTVNDEGTQPAVNDEGTQPTVNNEGAQPAVNGEDTEPAKENESAEPAEESEAEKAAALFQALPTADMVASMTDEELAAATEAATQALNAYDALSVEDAAAFEEAWPGLYDGALELVNALLTAGDTEVEDLSLKPMPETKNVTILLSDFTKETLLSYPVDEIITMMVDKNGDPIQVDENYTSAWFYFPNRGMDEYHTLNNGETVDLWHYPSNESSYIVTEYPMVLVLGNGKQLDSDNSHRYIITVDMDNRTSLSPEIDFSIYNEQGSQLIKYAKKEETDVFDALKINGIALRLAIENYDPSKAYDIGMSMYYNSREGLEHHGIKVDVYSLYDYLAFRDHGSQLTGAITDQIWQSRYRADMSAPATVENYKDATNLWCIVFSNEKTNEILGYYGCMITLEAAETMPEGSMWKYQDGKWELLDTGRIMPYRYSSSVYCNLDLESTGVNMMPYSYRTSEGCYESFAKGTYPEGYQFYYSISADANIKRVFWGYYSSETAALNAGAADITSQVLVDGTQQAPYGYPFTIPASEYATIIMQDGSVAQQYIDAYEYVSSPTMPSVGVDPYFNIEDVKGSWDTYVPSSIERITLDTYYRTDDKYDVGGYQILLINDTVSEADLKSLVPVFSIPDGVQVNSGGKAESGVTDLQNAEWVEGMDDTVAYQVHVPGEQVRNYRVTFASKQPEATLFVAGPDERFLNLTEDNDFIHDILVANLGGTALEGITVELIDPVNVRLDDYWTIGGEGNNSLPAFTRTSTGYWGDSEYYNNDYAVPENLAKIRLLPDGAGEISGTLKITASNGQSREIKLTGIAANPQITTGELANAVMYVPYSYMIATDNMYVWNRTTFKITSGSLPAGMEFYENTGEIYGVPRETGEFTFTVQANFSSSRFVPVTATFTLVVDENTNLNVYNQTDEGYAIETHLGTEQGDGTRDFLVNNYNRDQLYVSAGVFPEFVDLWLNGEKLVAGVDYYAESGSTRITIKGQTLTDKGDKDGYNTLAAEFRVDGDRNKELKRTAQNFRLGTIATGSSAPAATPTPEPVPQGVTLTFHLVDENGDPLAYVPVELHSTPRTGTTDGQGRVTFTNVEYGPHTLIVKNKAGEEVARRTFQLQAGSFGVNGDVFTVVDGGRLSIRLQLSGDTLKLLSVTAPQTGDPVDPKALAAVALFFGALALGAGLLSRKKRAFDR